jgi:hypothetical protein
MLGMLFAELATQEADPIAAAKTLREQMIRIMGRATSGSLSPEALTLERARLIDEVNRLFNEIEDRVKGAPGR